MEIREGIKFKSIYAPNTEFVLDKIEKNNLISRDNGKYKYTFEDVIANFKKDIWKLTYYPYKKGDYCIRTWPSGKKTLGVAWNFAGTDLYFKSLEDYNGEGGVIKNSVYGLLQDPYKGIYQRPVFKDEILTNKTENMNDLDKELKERESKLEKSTVNVKWNVVFPEIGAKEVYRTSNNKIKPNLIKHNNSRFQKLLIIRTNKSKHSGKTK